MEIPLGMPSPPILGLNIDWCIIILSFPTPVPPPGGVLRISSDGDDRRIFLGLKFSIPGIFGYENLASIFWGSLIWVGIFWGYWKESVVPWLRSSANKVQTNVDFFWVLLEALGIFWVLTLGSIRSSPSRVPPLGFHPDTTYLSKISIIFSRWCFAVSLGKNPKAKIFV